MQVTESHHFSPNRSSTSPKHPIVFDHVRTSLPTQESEDHLIIGIVSDQNRAQHGQSSIQNAKSMVTLPTISISLQGRQKINEQATNVTTSGIDTMSIQDYNRFQNSSQNIKMSEVHLDSNISELEPREDSKRRTLKKNISAAQNIGNPRQSIEVLNKA